MTQIFTIRHIQEMTARHYGVEVSSLLGRRRSAHVSWPRHVAIWTTAKVFPKRSLVELGRAFDRDHTSIMHACKHVDDLREVDKEKRQEIDLLINQLAATGYCVVGEDIQAKILAEEIVRAFRVAVMHMAITDPDGFMRRALTLLPSSAEAA